MATVGSAGKNLDLLIKQGSTFILPFLAVDADGTPRDLTGFAVRSQIRKTVRSSAITLSFTALIDPVPTTGAFTIMLTPAQTSALVVGESPASPESRFVWDLECESPAGVVTPLAFGTAVIHPEVTR